MPILTIVIDTEMKTGNPIIGHDRDDALYRLQLLDGAIKAGSTVTELRNILETENIWKYTLADFL